jgi:hypothetical protein
MARGDYEVFEDAGRWKVRHSGNAISFTTPRAALSAAISAAHESGKLGFGGRVLVQTDQGEWRQTWAYGQDVPSLAA